MQQTRTCPRGHDWDGNPAECPSCADDSWDESPASTFRDELPPPPRSVRIAPQSPNESPATVNGDKLPSIPGFELHAELGRGGMGTVYRARDLRLNRFVALKVISAGLATEPRELARFRAEAEAVAQLQHPNIVQVYEVGESSGRPYLSLELVAGGTLARALAGTPLPARSAAQFIETLARAIDYAHSKGVIHRDLKPGNILLQNGLQSSNPESGLKIVDFGLAKRIGIDSAQTTTGVVVGTPSYMAPEQAAGLSQFLGPACDIYALGAVLYELLTGRPPFHAASPMETLQQVVTVDPVPPARLQPKLPRDLETICLCCLQKEARKRYVSSGALADDLRRFLDGRPILARRTPSWERAIKWARRRPTAAALVSVCIAAIVALVALGVRHNRILERHNTQLEKAAADLSVQRDEATRQAALAELNLESANDAIEQMLKRVGIDRLASVPFMDKVRADLLEDAERFYDKLLAAQAGDRRLRVQRAHTLELSARVQSALGRTDRALAKQTEALAVIEEVESEEESPTRRSNLRRMKGLILNNRSLLLTAKGEYTKSIADQHKALEIREELLAAEPTNPELEFDVAASNLNLAVIARHEGRLEDQALFLGRAKPRAEALARDHADNDRYWYLLGLILNDLGTYHLVDKSPDLALQSFEAGVEIWRKVAAMEPGSLTYRAELARSLTNCSITLRTQGYYRRAATPLGDAIQIREQIAREHPEIWRAIVDLASSYCELGELYRMKSEYEEALAKSSLAIDRLESSAKKTRDDPRAQSILCDAYACRARAFAGAKKYPEAVEAYQLAIDLAEPQQRPELQIHRTLSLAANGNVEEAVREVELVLKTKDLDSSVLFNAAWTYALARSVLNEPATKEKERLAARAVAILQLAAKQGYFRRESHKQEVDQIFKDFRGRDDFKAFRAGLYR